MFGIKRKYDKETWMDYLIGHVLWNLGGRWLTFWWQRRIRGFDDSELWSLDYTMCKFMAPRLRALQEMVNGCPHDLLYGNGSDENFQAFHALPVEEQQRQASEAMSLWKEMLGKMAHAMELWVENDTFLEDEQKREWEEGMELFHKYLFGLWD